MTPRDSLPGAAAPHQQPPDTPASGQLKELLKRRAAELATRHAGAEIRKATAEVVVVRRGDFLFATPLIQTREVRQVQIALLPVSAGAISGLFQIRGRTDCLVDLAALLGEADPLPHGARTLTLIVNGPRGDVGLRIDEVIGSRQIFADEVAENATPFEWIHQITADRVHLIDIAGLMACADIRVGAPTPTPSP